MNAECIVCDNPKIFRRDRCDWCYRFFLRHGRDRPEEELVVVNYRRFVRGEERRLIRVAMGRRPAGLSLVGEPSPRRGELGTGGPS